MRSRKKAEFSLDIQLKDLEQPAKKDFGHQCYSLGAPILAMRDVIQSAFN